MITPEQLQQMRYYIRDNLQKIRIASGLSLLDFADKCRIAHKTIERIENGGLPTMVITYRLIDALKLKPEKI